MTTLKPTNPFLSPSFDTEDDPFPEAGTNLTGDSRTEARLCAVQALTQYITCADDDFSIIIKEFQKRHLKPRNADKKIFNHILETIAADYDRFEALITDQLPEGRTWENANPVHKAVLLAAVAEWQSPLNTPAKVSLNEFLNISKGFCPPEETAFLNGVLNTVMQKLMLV